MTTRTNIGKCWHCEYRGKLYGRQCWRCRKRTQMQTCVDCGGQCNPDATRCLRCSNAYQATLRGRPPNFNHDRILEMFEQDLSLSEIARRIGCTKNTISGYVWRQGWSRKYAGPTSEDRMNALHARMDAVMAETAALRAAGKLYLRTLPLDEAA